MLETPQVAETELEKFPLIAITVPVLIAGVLIVILVIVICCQKGKGLVDN